MNGLCPLSNDVIFLFSRQLKKREQRESWEYVILEGSLPSQSVCANASAKSPQLDPSVCCCTSGYTRYTVRAEYFKCYNGLLGVGRNIAGPHAIIILHHLRFTGNDWYANPMLISTVQYLNKLMINLGLEGTTSCKPCTLGNLAFNNAWPAFISEVLSHRPGF